MIQYLWINQLSFRRLEQRVGVRTKYFTINNQLLKSKISIQLFTKLHKEKNLLLKNLKMIFIINIENSCNKNLLLYKKTLRNLLPIKAKDFLAVEM